jgi:hypothetical protein
MSIDVSQDVEFLKSQRDAWEIVAKEKDAEIERLRTYISAIDLRVSTLTIYNERLTKQLADINIAWTFLLNNAMIWGNGVRKMKDALKDASPPEVQCVILCPNCKRFWYTRCAGETCYGKTEAEIPGVCTNMLVCPDCKKAEKPAPKPNMLQPVGLRPLDAGRNVDGGNAGDLCENCRHTKSDHRFDEDGWTRYCTGSSSNCCCNDYEPEKRGGE